MEELPRFTDLRAISAEISDQPAYEKIARIIDRAARLQSCTSDLAEAWTCVEALDELLRSPRKRGTLTRQATESALMKTAVMLYARGAGGGGKPDERGSFDIRSQLDGTALEDHETLIDVRNKALAHVVPGKVGGDIWHAEVLFAIEHHPAWLPAAASHRIQFNRKVFEQLKRQIPIGREILTGKFHDAIGKLITTLNDHPLPVAIYERHLMDPAKTFGSLAQARQVAEGWRDGRTTFLGSGQVQD